MLHRDEPKGHNAKGNKPSLKDEYCMIPSQELPRGGKLTETERTVVARGWGQGGLRVAV